MSRLDYLKQNYSISFSDNEVILYKKQATQNIRKFINSGLYVKKILWYQRVKIGSSNEIGLGGPIDPIDNEYYYTQTYIKHKQFDISNKTIEQHKLEVCNYIKDFYRQSMIIVNSPIEGKVRVFDKINLDLYPAIVIEHHKWK